MPTDKDFKKLVRTRAAKTGESYTTARAHLVRREPDAAARQPIVCAVTGATGRVAYNLLFRLAAGDVFGPRQPVHLRLLDVEDAVNRIEGTALELEDCSYPLLAGVDVTTRWDAGFDGASWALLLGAPQRTASMERADLLAATAAAFADQGAAIARTAASDVRVLVVGNPANTNALVARRAAPEVPDDRWTAMLRLDHNRARAQLASKAGAPLPSVTNVTVWGNHSPTMVPDAWHARIDGRPASEAVGEEWISTTFVPTVQQRGARIIEVAGGSSAASAAAAVVDSMRDLVDGTHARDWTTLGTVSSGEYGVPEGLVFGFPCTVTANGARKVVEGLAISAQQRSLLDVTIAELVTERDAALALAP